MLIITPLEWFMAYSALCPQLQTQLMAYSAPCPQLQTQLMAYSAPCTATAKATYGLQRPLHRKCKGNLLTVGCFTPDVPDAQNKSLKKREVERPSC